MLRYNTSFKIKILANNYSISQSYTIAPPVNDQSFTRFWSNYQISFTNLETMFSDGLSATWKEKKSHQKSCR